MLQISDPSEYHDLAKEQPAKLAEMRQLFFARNATAFAAPKLKTDTALCEKYVEEHGGYLGPYLGTGPDRMKTEDGGATSTVRIDIGKDAWGPEFDGIGGMSDFLACDSVYLRHVSLSDPWRL